jgi:hypothetical protein
LFFHSLWEKQRRINGRSSLKDLPMSLQLQIAYHVHVDVFRKIPSLAECPRVVQHELAFHLTKYSCSRGDYIYHQEDIGSEVYFVFSGQIKVVSQYDGGKGRAKNKPKGKPVLLTDGDFFGMDVFTSITGVRRATVQAVSDCDLFMLSKRAVESIMANSTAERRKHGFLWEVVKMKQQATSAETPPTPQKKHPCLYRSCAMSEVQMDSVLEV